MILTTSTDAQELKFIPRSYVADSIVVTDEVENTSTTYTPTFVQDSYYLKCDLSLNLKEDRHYSFTVLNGYKPVYKGKIFCTNQTSYSINKNEYTQRESTNEYITI
jgi:hypothetical protein